MRKRRKCDVLQRSRFEVGDGEIRRGKATGKEKKAILLAVCGLAVGAINGLFGAGGGMLAVPVLTFAAGLGEKKAHATAIAVILPLCLVSTVVYAVRGTFDYSVLPPTIAGVLIGGLTGAVALKKLSAPVLNFLFYGLMVFAGVKMMM